MIEIKIYKILKMEIRYLALEVYLGLKYFIEKNNIKIANIDITKNKGLLNQWRISCIPARYHGPFGIKYV
jgi:hypothetical protein